MASKGLLLASAITLALSLAVTAAGQELRKPPSYVGTAVFSAPMPYAQYPAQLPAQFPAQFPGQTALEQLKLAEIYGKIKEYAAHALEVIKTRLKGTETFVLAGMIGGGLVYLFNLIKSLFGKCKTTSVNQVWAGKPHGEYGYNNYYKSVDDANDIDVATSRVYTAVATGECLQKAACLIGKQTGLYNNSNDMFRFLKRLPSQAVMDAFLKAADGFDDCSVYDCD